MASREVVLKVLVEKFPLLYCMSTLVRVVITTEEGKHVDTAVSIEVGNTVEKERFLN